jgi:hypothetical protein
VRKKINTAEFLRNLCNRMCDSRRVGDIEREKRSTIVTFSIELTCECSTVRDIAIDDRDSDPLSCQGSSRGASDPASCTRDHSNPTIKSQTGNRSAAIILHHSTPVSVKTS